MEQWDHSDWPRSRDGRPAGDDGRATARLDPEMIFVGGILATIVLAVVTILLPRSASQPYRMDRVVTEMRISWKG